MKEETQKKKKSKHWNKNDITLFVMASLGLAWLAVFCYAPMFGVLLAFKDADRKLDIWNALLWADWVGFANFKEFLIDPNFSSVFWNTLGLNVINLLVSFPAPILFALLLNEIRFRRFRVGVQTVANFPHFIFLLMSISSILGNNFEQFYTLQNSINLSKSEVLSTYSYKMGISERRYAYTSALGLFNSLIGFTLLTTSNAISKKFFGRGLY